MSWRQLFGDNRNRSVSNYAPYEIGTESSQLVKIIEERHGGVEMSEEEQNIFRMWIGADANYTGDLCWRDVWRNRILSSKRIR